MISFCPECEYQYEDKVNPSLTYVKTYSWKKKKKKIYLAISDKDNVHRRIAYFQHGP